jgi:Nif-specific regulatory protein
MDEFSLESDLLAVRSLDVALGDRLALAFERLKRAGYALAWARERLPRFVAAGCGSSQGVLEALVDEARMLTGAPEVWAVTWSGDVLSGRGSFRALAGHSADGAPVGANPELLAPDGLSRTIVGRALRDGKAAWSDDAAADARFAQARSVQALALRSVGCVPLGKRGVLYLYDPETPGRFGARERDCLVALCAVALPFVERPAASPRPRPIAPVPGLVGEAPPMLDLFAAIHAFAPMPWPALVLGETGTGKEAVARALHTLSPRAALPFVPVNCGAIPDELAESTLFGHERGSFTGADRRKEGLVERVRGGTLFLDEVGELSPRVQVKLLRLLQEGTYERVGGDREVRFEGRIVAATHRRIDDPASRGGFREDLFHRLSACVLHVPPLRDRRGDVPALARHLLERALAELPGGVALEFDAGAERWLEAHPWPGNVRELSNVVRRAVPWALGRRSDRIGVEDLARSGLAVTVVADAVPRDLEAATDAFQRHHVTDALARAGGNKSKAADDLGVSRQWLHRLLARWEDNP